MSMNDYRPIPVDAAVEIAERFTKDQVLILGVDKAHNKTHFTTYGREPNDKELIAALGDYLGQHLTGSPLSERTNYEDYRFADQGQRAAHNRELCKALKRLSRSEFPLWGDGCWSCKVTRADALRRGLVRGSSPRIILRAVRGTTTATGGGCRLRLAAAPLLRSAVAALSG